MQMFKSLVFLCIVAYVVSYPLEDESIAEHEQSQHYQTFVVESGHQIRLKRSPFTEGEGGYGNGQEQKRKPPGWEVNPDLRRDDKGNVKGKVEIERRGENHDVNAGWGQTIRGPNKHSETWHVGGTFRW